MKKIKLLVLLNNLDGGTGSYLSGILKVERLFNKGEIDIRVLALNKPEFRTVNYKNISFYRSKSINNSKYNFSPKSISAYLGEFKWFGNKIRNYKPDLVMSSNPHCTFIAETGRILFGVKYKTISLVQNNLDAVIGYKIPYILQRFTKILLSDLLNHSNAVISVSEDMSKALVKDYLLKKPPFTIPAILESRKYRDSRAGSKQKTNKIIITVSRLDPQKDNETLLRAFKIVNDKYAYTELWIVGDGPLMSELKILAKDLGIENKIKFIGWAQNPGHYLKEADIFVLSSKWEGLGLTLLEAMRYGLPCIASDCRFGPAEVMGQGKYGMLFPPSSRNKLADSLIKLLKNSNLRRHYTNMSAQRVKDYSESKMLPLLKQVIIDTLLGNV